MKQALHMKMGQSLAMTPQLQQAIRLLQLSTLELQSEIQDALEANPLLEVNEEDQRSTNEEAASTTRQEVKEVEAETAHAKELEIAGDGFADSPAEARSDESLQSETMPDELPVDSAWEDVYEPSYTASSSRGEEGSRDFTEFHSSGAASLQDHLLEQLYLSPLSSSEHQSGAAIIEAIDDAGYLTDPLEDIIESSNQDLEAKDHMSVETAEKLLSFIQRLDPIGCGARNIGECMYVQLEQLPSSAIRDRSLTVVGKHLALLGAHDLPKIRREMKITEAELHESINLIRSVNPRPGAQITANSAQYIVPDVFVRRERNAWKVELNPDIAPRLGINSLYASMVKRADKSDDNTFIRNHLQEARWFIKSLQSRNETLLRVATAIVEHQRDFLEHGEMAMKPLVLRDIAEQLEMHESTISRVTTQKFMHTPRGIHEFKFFFSSHVATADGGECSATAIRAMIRELVANEDHQSPLSDSKIASTLVSNGIKVARRTIAKYRESMAIPPSNERKRLN